MDAGTKQGGEGQEVPSIDLYPKIEDTLMFGGTIRMLTRADAATDLWWLLPGSRPDEVASPQARDDEDEDEEEEDDDLDDDDEDLDDDLDDEFDDDEDFDDLDEDEDFDDLDDDDDDDEEDDEEEEDDKDAP